MKLDHLSRITLFALATSSLSSIAGCTSHEPAVIACNADAAAAIKPGQMTMTGTATLEVSPDCADLTMTLGVEALVPSAATAQADAKQRAIVDALGKLGVAGADLKLSTLNLGPVYDYDPHTSQGKLRGYSANITITATTRDFTKISAIMEAGATAGATQMSSQFRNDEMPKLKAQVRDMALAAVQAKAKQTAHALETKVGRVLLVAENAGGQMWSQSYFPQAQANAVESRGNASVLGGTLQPLTLDVTVTYELVNPS